MLLNRPDAVSFGLQNRRRNSYVPESRRDEQMQAPQTRNFRSVSVSDQLSASFVSADSSATSAHRSSTTGTTESSSAMLSAVEAATSQSRAGLSNSPLPLCSSVNGEQSSATSSTLLSDSSTSDDDTNDDDTRPRYRAMLGDLGLSRALTSGVVVRHCVCVVVVRCYLRLIVRRSERSTIRAGCHQKCWKRRLHTVWHLTCIRLVSCYG